MTKFLNLFDPRWSFFKSYLLDPKCTENCFQKSVHPKILFLSVCRLHDLLRSENLHDCGVPKICFPYQKFKISKRDWKRPDRLVKYLKNKICVPFFVFHIFINLFWILIHVFIFKCFWSNVSRFCFKSVLIRRFYFKCLYELTIILTKW